MGARLNAGMRWCVALGLLALIAMGGMAQGEISSVLNRAQVVDDPELGELILAVIENHSLLGEKELLERVREVTKGYAQIKLLDQQIEQIGRRAESIGGPGEVRYELLLARAELESRRTSELATLREVMGIIPRHAFGRRKVSALTTFVDLDVIGRRVYLLERSERFIGETVSDRFRAVGLMSGDEALDYVAAQMAKKERLPIRIDIHRTVDGIKLSEDLYDALIGQARQAKVQMESEIHLGPVREGQGEFVLTLIESVPPTIDGVYRVGGRPTLSLVDGRPAAPQEVDANHVGGFVRQWLSKPDYLPTRFRIVYPSTMQPLAEETAAAIEEVARSLGIGAFVDVAYDAVEADTEGLYLGRWRASGQSMILAIDVSAENRCQFVMADGLESTGVVTRVPGRWSLAGRQIRMTRSSYTYQGYISPDGDLLLCRRRINRQGNRVAGVAEEPVIFRKLE